MFAKHTLRADPEWGLPPLQLPLMGAWFCKNFSPVLMPMLYLGSLAILWPSHLRKRSLAESPCLDRLLESYPTSLFPVLTLALEMRLFDQVTPPGCRTSLNVGMSDLDWSAPEEHSRNASASEVSSSNFPDGATDLYRLNNVIHQVEDRELVLKRAAQQVRPGGYLQLTDNTQRWVDAMWTVRLARRLGHEALAQRLIQDKLHSSHQNLVSDENWWVDYAEGSPWELVEARPFFSTKAMTVASLFESLNFKQGGTSPDWLTKRILRNPLLRPLYRLLIGRLCRLLLGLDDDLVTEDGATSLMVTLRRRGGDHG